MLHILDRPSPQSVPSDPLDFLASLRGPTAWQIPGRDSSRLRIVTTLLHGNEPSGFLALHGWLQSGIVPAVDTICLIANVEAAARHPVFTHRSVPSRRDLNRCFDGPYDDREGNLAREILDLIERRTPEALIDLHNNTGHNPAYAIGTNPSIESFELTALFGEYFIWSHLKLGALLEAVPICPTITVEVGKSGEDIADLIALTGVSRYLESESLFGNLDAAPEVKVLTMPMRARIRVGQRLAMAQQVDPSATFTMPDDLDRHNFQTVDAGSRIGWVRGDGCPLELIDERGVDCADAYFERSGDELIARRPFMPIMITVDAAVASSDCLFYVVHDVDGEGLDSIDAFVHSKQT